jgi:tetratricopeptide (TPR) repeat protein
VLSQAVALAITLFLPQAQSDGPKAAARFTASADVLRRSGQFDEAIAAYRQALAFDPGCLPARRGLGLVFDLTGRYADARTEYLAGLEGRTESYEAAPFFWNLATSYVFDRHFDDAHAALQRWADLGVKRRGYDPHDSWYFFELAMAGDAFDEAERMLEEHFAPIEKPPAIALSPPPDSHLLMTELRWMRYNAERADVSARRGRAADARRFMGEAEIEARKIDQLLAALAAAAGLKAVSLNPSRELMRPEGEAAFWLGDNRRALRLLSAVDFKFTRDNLLLGQAYERDQNLVEARAAYTRVVESTEVSIELAWARPIAQARLAAIGVSTR